MKEFPVPVRMIGPGSQPLEDEELQYLPMPHSMSTFQMPRIPERADPGALRVARDLLAEFHALLAAWNPADTLVGPRLALTGVPASTLALVNDMLGEGEVSIRVEGERTYRIQESVFTGLWRVCALDGDGRLVDDWLEAGGLPPIVTATARAGALPAVPAVEMPAGAMNSPAVLAEIGSKMAAHREGDAAHVVNLTLFPMTPEDHVVLEQALPVGGIAMISRGFGNCHISSTKLRDVWRVQYFNSMKTLILNTIEVVDVPVVALAAAEDLVESRTRLSDLVDWLTESCDEVTEH
jgi:hydrogenase-1 operon protein HyaF